MEITTYKNLEWYIIKETDKEKLLFLRECLTNEQILRYFTEKLMVNSVFDVRFNNKQSPWWDESYIQKVLNTTFLSDLDKNDLNKMKTTLKLNGETRVVEDYVRLITYEEALILPTQILKTEREHGYWTMSPFFANIHSNSNVLIIHGSDTSIYDYDNSGHLGSNGVYASFSVRPVISIKPDILKSNIITEESMIGNISREELIKKLTLGRKILGGIK